MVVEAVARLHQFFKTGDTRSISFRHQQLSKLKNAIITHQQQLLDAVQQDLSKPDFESYMSEFHLIIQEINYALSEMHSWARPWKVPMPLINFPSKSMLQPEPRGVVLIIGAWNYPLHLVLIPLIGAIAAGNCAVIKPSEQAPACAQILATLIAKIFPPDYITVIEGDAQKAQQLLEQKFDYIFFTGSPRVGKIVMSYAAQHLTPVTLELGGKNPCIVTQHANLDCAAKRIVWGKFYNAGQNCISPDYLLVADSIKTIFIEKLIFWIKKFYGENPRTSTDYARIINDKHFTRLETLLAYGTIIFGGITDRAKKYMSPTLLDSIDLHSPLMHEEIFGPILPIISYNAFDDIIHFVTERPHPLALYLFSNDAHEKNIVQYETQSGAICFNDTLVQATSPYLPFGGLGNSGFGAYHGKKTFDTFTHYKPIVTTSCHFDHGLRYPPYGKKHHWFKKIVAKFY